MAPQRRNHLLWIGPAVVFTGFVSYYKVFAFYPDLRDFPWVNLPWVLIGVALTVLGARRAFSPLRPPTPSTLRRTASCAPWAST